MTLLGYARVSSPSDTEGLKGQVERIEKWASSHGRNIEIFAEVVSASGENSRPIFNETMERALANGVDGIVVDSLDRFGRSIRDILFHANQLDSAGKALITLKQSIDTSTATGRFLFHVLSAVAELEREMISDRMREGRERARALGRKLGGPTPKILPKDLILRDRGMGASMRYLAGKWEVSESTIRRRIKEWTS